MKTIIFLAMFSVGCAVAVPAPEPEPEPEPCEDTQEGCEEEPPVEGAPCKAEIECSDGMWCVITDSPTEGVCKYVDV